MARLTFFLLFAALALAAPVPPGTPGTPDDLIPKLVGALTDVKGVLTGFQSSLSIVGQMIFVLLKPVALLAVFFAILRTLWQGMPALFETAGNILVAAAVVGLSVGLWSVSINVWLGAKDLGMANLKTETKTVGTDLDTLSTSVSDFLLLSYATTVSSGRSEVTSDATEAPLDPAAGSQVRDNFAAVVLFQVALLATTLVFYAFVLYTGTVVVLQGAFFPLIALNYLFSGSMGTQQFLKALFIILRAIFLVILVPIIFGFVMNLAITQPVNALNSMVQEALDQQKALSTSISQFANDAVTCDTACQLVYKDQRDALVNNVSTFVSNAIGGFQRFGILLIIMAAMAFGAVVVVRRFEQSIVEVLGGLSSGLMHGAARQLQAFTSFVNRPQPAASGAADGNNARSTGGAGSAPPASPGAGGPAKLPPQPVRPAQTVVWATPAGVSSTAYTRVYPAGRAAPARPSKPRP